MSTKIEAERPPGSSLYVTISNAIVGLMREYTGRGPTKARTTVRDNVVVVMLEHTLTKGERVLVEKGRGENVLALRREYQEAMREEASAKVGEITGRNVLAMMSANHLDPDLAVELFVLDGPPERRPAAIRRLPSEGVHLHQRGHAPPGRHRQQVVRIPALRQQGPGRRNGLDREPREVQ